MNALVWTMGNEGEPLDADARARLEAWMQEQPGFQRAYHLRQRDGRTMAIVVLEHAEDAAPFLPVPGGLPEGGEVELWTLDGVVMPKGERPPMG